MNLLRLILLVVAGGFVLGFQSLCAQENISPSGTKVQFSADMVITTDEGPTFTQKIYSDNGKARTEVTVQDMPVIMIIRPDLQKAYSVMESQKVVMELPYDPKQGEKIAMASSGPEGKSEMIGPDTVDGEACTKYKVTAKEGKVYFLWTDVASKVPVKMMADDKSLTILWKNYHAGPQDASLFEVPTGYQVMKMPSMPGVPAGTPTDGQ